LLLIMHCSLFVAYHALLIVCCLSCIAHYLLLIMYCSLFVSYHALLIVCCPLIVCCLSCIAHYLLLIMHCSLFVAYHALLINCCVACTACYILLIAYHYSAKHLLGNINHTFKNVLQQQSLGEIGCNRTAWYENKTPYSDKYICSITSKGRWRCSEHLHPTVPWAARIYPKPCLTQKTSNWRA